MSKQSEDQNVDIPETVAEHQAMFPKWVIPMCPTKEGTDDHKKAAMKWKKLDNTPREAHQSQNVAVATGKKSGIFVVDVDKKKEGDEKEDGSEAWEKLIKEHELVECNHVVHSASGGFHAYFVYDERLADIPNAAGFEVDKKPVGIDVRTNGGYIVIPPSCKPDGAQYRWNKLEGGADHLCLVPQ